MLNCSNANKIQCRPDLFGAWFWECGFVADLSHSRLLHRLCLLILPIPSKASLGFDNVLDFFIMPGITSSRVVTQLLIDSDANCKEVVFNCWIVGSWTNYFCDKNIGGKVKHLQMIEQEVKLSTHDVMAHDIFHQVCFLFVGCFVDPLAPHPWNLRAWHPMSSKVSFHWISLVP